MILTEQIIRYAASNRGGWNKPQLEAIGVEWPPLKGWLKRLVGKDFPDEQIEKFKSLRRGGEKQWLNCGGACTTGVKAADWTHCPWCGMEKP